MALRAALAWLWAAAHGVALAAATDTRHEQCKDPLFETHWAPKNDIQTLTAFPNVKTNLKLCPYYNQKASCCHQTFESEQHKYYGFWNTVLKEKLYRINSHREAVMAESLIHGNLSAVDREQYLALLAAYKEVLSPHRQQQCFSNLLTYVAGMMCFSCKPAWFHYTTFEGDDTTAEHVVRVRMARSVCLELWASCEEFGGYARALDKAIRDSRVARSAPRAVENMDMFMGQQYLCDWMHDLVALHPFRLPNKEDRDTMKRAPSGAAQVQQDISARRLMVEKELDVLQEGRVSGFDREWRSPAGMSSAVSLLGKSRLLAPLLCIVSLGGRV